MGIRKPLGVSIAALGLGAALLSSSPASADPPKLKSPVTKGIKPLPTAAASTTPVPAATPAPVATPAPTAKPAPTTAPAPTTTTAPSASAAPVKTAAPATSGSTAPVGSAATGSVDPTLASLKLSKLDDRLEALRVRVEARTKTMPDRKKAEQDRTRLRWGSLVDAPAVRTELAAHGTNVARLERIRELAIVEGKQPVADRATKALDKESVRHEAKMSALAAGGGK